MITNLAMVGLFSTVGPLVSGEGGAGMKAATIAVTLIRLLVDVYA